MRATKGKNGEPKVRPEKAIKEEKSAREIDKKDIYLPEGAKKARFPGIVEPMLTKLIDRAFDDKDWVFEWKWDGYRALAYIRKGKVKLISRRGNEFTKYVQLNKELSKCEFDSVLDGEIAVLDKEGRPSFQLLQNFERIPGQTLYFFVFDILYYGGYNVTHAKLTDRKALLKEILPQSETVVYSEHFPGKGTEMYERAQKKGLEGIIGKRADSVYRVGKRSDDWVKVKVQSTQEGIIVGYTDPKGTRKYIGTLILAAHDKGRLRFIGASGGGFTVDELKELKETLEPMQQEEPVLEDLGYRRNEIHWVRPELVCEVAYSEWTKDGTLRHPVFKGMRPDKRPEQVVMERVKSMEKIVKKKK